jgi:hypothetical protein
MLEYLDPYHWRHLALVPHEDAQWRPKVMVDYDLQDEMCYWLEVDHGTLYHVTEDECRHMVERDVCSSLRAHKVYGLGESKRSWDAEMEEGVRFIPILTSAGPYMYQRWDGGGYIINDHPGPPSVFYPA